MPLDGSNFLVWSRSIYVFLGTRMKLGFINGSFPAPTTGSKTFEHWRRADLMVTSWIWNSISKDIVEAFMYVSSSRELWLELQRRYGRSNGPMLYQLQRELSTVSQGDLSITAYLTKFLMGLHEVYDSERSQVLMMDPLPDVEKAYAMFLETMPKKKPFVDKRSLVCDHCHKTGHTKESCFKLHGMPDWYKVLPEQRKKGHGVKNFTAAVDVVSEGNGSGQNYCALPKQDNITAMMSEILKLVKQQNMPSDPLTANYANYVRNDDEFADITLFHSYAQPKHSQFITLPDGSKKSVSYTGTVQLTADLVLDHDHNSKKILAKGLVHKRLYMFKQDTVSHVPNHVSCFATNQCNNLTWHKRLGHSSVQALKHLSVYTNSQNDPADF
ncbi:UNVERIFIED_CONTAM: hypothetical protein Slati_3784800, partial [Sesamum latifolium]